MDDKEFLTYFDGLSKGDEKQVIENAEKMLTTLLTNEYKTPTKSSNFNSKLGNDISEDIDYAVNRIIKGSTSDSMNSKVGYVFPLVNLLRHFKILSTEKVAQLIIELTDKKLAMSKSERTHFHISRMMNLFAILLSGRIDNSGNALDQYSKLYDIVLENLSEYPWSSQLGLQILSKSLELKSEKDEKLTLKKANLLAKQVKLRYKNKQADNLLEKLGVALILNKFYLENSKENNDYFDNIITKVNEDPQSFKKAMQSCVDLFPEKNFILRLWAQYVCAYLNEGQQKNFLQAVSDLVEAEQKKDEPSFKLYFVVLTLLKYYVKAPQFSPKIFEHFITTPVFALWIKNLFLRNNMTNGVARAIEKHLGSKLSDLIAASTNLAALKLLKTFKNHPGYSFAPNSRMASALFNLLTIEDVRKYLDFLVAKFEEQRTMHGFMFYLGEVHALGEVKGPSLPAEIVGKIANFLIVTSLEFSKSEQEIDDVEEDPNEPIDKTALASKITKRVKEEAQTKMNSVVMKLMKTPHTSFVNKKNNIWQGLTQDYSLWIYVFLQEMNQILKQKTEAPSYYKVFKVALKKCSSYIEEIKALLKFAKEEEKSSRSKKLIGLTLLLCCSALSLPYYSDLKETVEEMMIAIDEYHKSFLNIAEENFKQTKDKKKKLNNEKVGSKKSNRDNKSVQILNDIMISLLTRSAGYLREAVNRAFRQIVGHIDTICLGNLLAVLIRKEQEYLEDMVDEQDAADDMEEEEGEEENGLGNDGEENGRNNESEDDESKEKMQEEKPLHKVKKNKAKRDKKATEYHK